MLNTKQPNHDNFEKLGKLNDFTFQALAHMGNASHLMAWANTVIEDVKEVPEELKAEMIQVNTKIHELQVRLRKVRNELAAKPTIESNEQPSPKGAAAE